MIVGKQTVDELLVSLASKQPTPGGGAVAGILAALSTSLGQMVVAYTEGKKKYSEHDKLHHDCIAFLVAAKNEALILCEEDASAYESLNSLWKLDKDDPTRITQWNSVLQNAIDAPLKTMELSHRILVTLQTLVGKTNTMLSSDLVIATILAESAARSARLNVAINLQQMEDGEEKSSIENRSASLLRDCRSICDSIELPC